jgi:hypothetical protein
MRWDREIAKEVAWDVKFALTFKIGRAKRPLTEDERIQVARQIVEHLQLANWIIERGEPAEGGSATMSTTKL